MWYVADYSPLSSLIFISLACIAIANGHLNRRRSGSFQAPRGGLYFRDSSDILFSMFSKLVEEDNKLVGRWQEMCKEILFFVSPTIASAFILLRA
jgi:hypothetical protein